MGHAKRELPPNNQAAKVYSLVELAAELDPDTYQEWLEARRARAAAVLRGDAGLGAVARRDAVSTMNRWLYQVEPSEEQKQQSRGEAAQAKLIARLRDVLASPDYCTQGIGPSGENDVPRRVAHQLKVDLDTDTLSLASGMTWQGVTMRRVGSLSLATPRPAPDNRERDDEAVTSEKAAANPHEVDAVLQAKQQGEVNDWYAKTYVPLIRKKFPACRPGRKDDVAAARLEFNFNKLRDMVYLARDEFAPERWRVGGPRGADNSKFVTWLKERARVTEGGQAEATALTAAPAK